MSLIPVNFLQNLVAAADGVKRKACLRYDKYDGLQNLMCEFEPGEICCDVVPRGSGYHNRNEMLNLTKSPVGKGWWKHAHGSLACHPDGVLQKPGFRAGISA